MSQARLRELADAVAALINADEWPLPFVATRSYRPHYVAASDALEVCVRPFKRERVGPVGRVKSEWHYTIDIVVMRKCEFRDNDQVDPLLDLSYSLADRFEPDAAGSQRRVLTSPLARVVKVEDMPAAYAWEYALDDQFTSVKRLTVQVVE